MSSQLGNLASSEASTISFFRRQFAKPKPVPHGVQLNGQVAVVTGSSSGLGFEASRQLLQLGLSHLVLAVRSQEKGEAAAKTLGNEFPDAALSVWLLELESYKSIQAFVDRCKTLPRIDIVILNAGLQKPSYITVAETGHETMMQVNYLSTILLAILLLPVLKSNKASSATRPPVISLVGSDLAYSVVMERKDPILKQLDNPTTYSQLSVYSKAKLLLLLSVIKLSEFVDCKEVLVNVTNPGMTKDTQMFRESPWVVQQIFGAMNAMLGRSVQVAASNYVYSTVVLGKESHGAFTSDWGFKP